MGQLYIAPDYYFIKQWLAFESANLYLDFDLGTYRQPHSTRSKSYWVRDIYPILP